MILRIAPILARLLLRLIFVLVGIFIVAIVGLVYKLDSRPDLSVWHLANLDAEFTADADVSDFDAYLRLEEELFEQLDQQVVARVDTTATSSLNRYSRGSHSDPERWPRNWNRSFELRPENPVASALLLHGLSDAPYSMRALAERLHERGVAVLGLRVPGHGTAPSGLVRVRWQDMTAAVRLAARHLHDQEDGKPLYLVGYSNGGALAVEYTLSSLTDASLPRPSGVMLLSPEIGVSRLAVFAVWQGRLGRVLGLEKLAWSSIAPEYDPYKYNSFAINAGDVAYRMTARVQEQLDALEDTGKLDAMPPLLAFQSAVDATVSAPALVENLFARLSPPDHELVLFDVSRHASIAHFIANDPRSIFRPMFEGMERDFTLTVVSNESPGSEQVVALTRAPGSNDVTQQVPLDQEWPDYVYSLSHIALPFSPLDPLYGSPQAPPSPGVRLGNVALHGEKGVLVVAPSALLRMHWNPFYDYVESRMLDFMDLGGDTAE